MVLGVADMCVSASTSEQVELRAHTLTRHLCGLVPGTRLKVKPETVVVVCNSVIMCGKDLGRTGQVMLPREQCK